MFTIFLQSGSFYAVSNVIIDDCFSFILLKVNILGVSHSVENDCCISLDTPEKIDK